MGYITGELWWAWASGLEVLLKSLGFGGEDRVHFFFDGAADEEPHTSRGIEVVFEPLNDLGSLAVGVGLKLDNPLIFVVVVPVLRCIDDDVVDHLVVEGVDNRDLVPMDLVGGLVLEFLKEAWKLCGGGKSQSVAKLGVVADGVVGDLDGGDPVEMGGQIAGIILTDILLKEGFGIGVDLEVVLAAFHRCAPIIKTGDTVSC